MVEWRARGFVEDSDDDEPTTIPEEAGLEKCLHDQPATTIPGARVAADDAIKTSGPLIASAAVEVPQDDFRDIDELQLDYCTPPTVRTNCRPSIARGSSAKDLVQETAPEYDAFPFSSSPLSSAPASPPPTTTSIDPPRSSARLRTVSLSTRRMSTSNHPDDSSPLSSPHLPSNLERQEAGSMFLRRILRQRNPIQLHPYQLESEQYRQTLKARGLRPVQIGGHERQGENGLASHVETRQEQHEMQSSSQLSEYTPARSYPPPSDLFDDRVDQATGTGTSSEGHLIGQSGGRPVKRRKLNHITRLEHQQSRINHVSEPTNAWSATDPFDLSSSPETDQAPDEADEVPIRRRKFRLPRGVPQAQLSHLPTPAPSSDNARPDHALEYLSSDSDVESLPRSPSNRLRSTPSSVRHGRSPSLASDAGFNTQHVVALKKATKRIKGVLPASWLRLDRQAQQVDVRISATDTRSPSPVRERKGVAQRIIRHRPQFIAKGSLSGENEYPHTTTSVAVVDIGDDCLPPLATDACLDGTQRHDAEDVEEEDWIDSMLQSSNGFRQHRTFARRKRQMRLPAALARGARPQALPKPTLRSGEATRGSRNSHAVHSSRVTPALSILDAPSPASHQALPDFVRLAMRRVRARPDRGRHSVSKKQISLHNRKDDQEAQQFLRHWRKGKLPARSERSACTTATGALPPIPLAPQQNNQQTRLPSPIRMPKTGPPGRGTTSDSSILQTRDTLPPTLQMRKQQTRLDLLPRQRIKQEPGTLPQYMRDPPLSVPSRRPQPKAGGATRSPRSWWMSAIGGNHPGQIEDLEDNDVDEHPHAVFQQRLIELDANFEHHQAHDEIMLDADRTRPTALQAEDLPRSYKANAHLPNGRQRKVQPRKSQPQRLSFDKGTHLRLHFEDHFPQESGLGAFVSQSAKGPLGVQLKGLELSGHAYTPDFGFLCLCQGTFFHSESFIGSGALADVLQTGHHEQDSRPSGILVQFQKTTRRWQAWTVETADEIRKLLISVPRLHAVLRDGPADLDDLGVLEVLDAPKNVIAYFSRVISFHDPADRLDCVQRTTEMLQHVLELHNAVSADRPTMLQDSTNFNRHLRLLTLFNVLAFQNMRLASDLATEHEIVQGATDLFRETARTLSSSIINEGVDQLIRDIRGTMRDTCLRDNQASATAVVVLRHLLCAANLPDFALWDVFDECLASREPHKFSDASRFESSWQDIFAILPFLDFDAHGFPERRTRRLPQFQNWTFVKSLVVRTIDLYKASDPSQAFKMNAYMRAMLGRCLVLVQHWGWKKDEDVVSSVFDFFASRSFSFLNQEGARGSPAFLSRLNEVQSMERTIKPSDSSFDIFLKLLAVSVHGWQGQYSEKKLKNMIWRLIPMHGRRHAKEMDLAEEDLAAIRNQHNILCVLYWSAPPALRIDLKHIRDLVDIQQSHLEVCRVNIRSWENLARFQVSVDEGVEAIRALASWFDSCLKTLITLHHEARPEAEAQYARSTVAASTITKSGLETIITRNERQVEVLLTMALASLVSVLEHAEMKSTAQRLFEHCDLTRILALFEPKKCRFTAQIILALDVYNAYFHHLAPLDASSSINDSNEDSQDYGEWSALEHMDDEEDAALTDSVRQALPALEKAITEVHEILSNAFGADTFSDKVMLSKLVDTWVCDCRINIKLSSRTWKQYIDKHSSRAWCQLRDTAQTRTFTPYFFSKVLEEDAVAYDEQRIPFLTTWLISLVDKESALQYQHTLTNTLMNKLPSHELLQNLPFSKDSSTGQYKIALLEMRQRRISLISSIFANMRSSIGGTIDEAQAHNLRQDYATIMRLVMAEMKKTYEETRQGSTVRGAYVDFVQQVVELMQQYLADIVTVDRYFTDSAAFPLPTTDPAYVVGRLKRYRLSLSDERSQKRLSAFLQTVCERAAVDNQQSYLVTQLAKSVEGMSETGEDVEPTLRILLLEALFPCYLEQALSPCGWILALPVLRAAERIFDNLFCTLETKDDQTMATLRRMTTAFLRPLRRAVSQVSGNLELLKQPQVSLCLTTMCSAATSILPIIDFLHIGSDRAGEAEDHLIFVNDFAAYITNLMREVPVPLQLDAVPYDTDDLGPPFDGVAEYCRKELRDALRTSWHKHEDRYYVTRGSSRREVIIALRTDEEELQSLAAGLEHLQGEIQRRSMLRRET